MGKASSDEEESSEEEGSGSEDSSDMDVEECEKKRFEFLGDLTELESQFAILREQLYRERLTQIETKQEEVKTGLATEYIQPLDELQENLRVQLDVGLVLRRLRQENIECDYSLTFRDQNGNTHGACQRRDNTGRTWCYTTGWDNNCGDLQRSNRYQNNPWSYRACGNQG